MTNALASQAQQLQVARLAASRDLTAIRPAPDQTVLFAAISAPEYDARVFFVDLTRLVLFLIDPVRCNGGVIDLNLKPTLIASAQTKPPFGAVVSGDRPELTASNWRSLRLPTTAPAATATGRSPVL
jgi:hypothetical protein